MSINFIDFFFVKAFLMSASFKGAQFEKLALNVLKNSLGLESIVHVGQAGDGGRDLIAKWNQMTLIVQCKHHKQITPPVFVRELEGILANDQIGILVTSASWSKQAMQRLHVSPKQMIGMVIDSGDGTIKSHHFGLVLQRNQAYPSLLHAFLKKQP
jgi:hypothetical protein